ncbi:hypothetical protein [Allokutzneria albata]|uniref:Uncharacterized protein n=1 Tax=Allokutzneria albata TaxID=211114 RepID=A0A1G9UFU7_ALLAB|nr:hypothetical protein [Allokutzneria albata]SDM58405.1 hypothetical protein SAMN04489726_2370 [Allokutzneria albata]
MLSQEWTHSGYVPVGPRDYLDRFLHEFGLTADDVRDRITLRPTTGEDEWLVHESLLRSHGEFPCAGDAEALEFCREIVNEMVTELGFTRAEAVARVNRQWSDPGPDGRTPRVWIVGLDIAYHEDAAYWARHMSSDS